MRHLTLGHLLLGSLVKEGEPYLLEFVRRIVCSIELELYEVTEAVSKRS